MASWQVPTIKNPQGSQESWRQGGQPTGETWRGLRSPQAGQSLDPYEGPRLQSALKNAYSESVRQQTAGQPIAIEHTPQVAPAAAEAGTPWQSRVGGSIAGATLGLAGLDPTLSTYLGAKDPKAIQSMWDDLKGGDIKGAFSTLWNNDWW